MKRAAVILLTFVYLLSCSGVAVNRFYCCGKLKLVNLTYGASVTDHQSHKNNSGCCRHETQNLKLKDTHFNTSSLSISSPMPVIIAYAANAIQLKLIKLSTIGTCYQSNAPPGNTDIPIYTLNCIYRV